MTIAEQLRKEGKKEGKIEYGREMVLEALTARFKKVSNEIAGKLCHEEQTWIEE